MGRTEARNGRWLAYRCRCVLRAFRLDANLRRCGRRQRATFIWERSAKQSRPTACGWMGHDDGMTVEQMDALRKANKLGLKEAFFLDWLELFRRLGPEMAPQTE